MSIALLYHDVVPRDREEASGFPGPGAARYKLTPEEFGEHLGAIAAQLGGTPVVTVGSADPAPAARGLLLTFDDGGASAFEPIAGALEQRNWRGHFFITADYLDTPTFVTREQIREMRRRGHVIGSHSCSHPERMSCCDWDRLLREWSRSRAILADVLGEPVVTASVPGGYYSRTVARAAAAAGIRVLFTSEPTARPHTVDGCLVLGRYTVYQGMSAGRAAAMASGRLLPRVGQALFWKAKKVAKAVGGRLYLSLRRRLLARANQSV